jgi:hypothetical protein
MKKHNQILAAVLVLQILLVLVIFWPRSSASGGESAPLLGEMEAGDIVALTIEDNNGERITLSKETGNWVLPDADDYPAVDDTVNALLEKLVALKNDRLVTRTAASHQRLQVAASDFMRRVDLETAAGETHTLFLGSSPSYGAAHVRLAGEDEAYLVGDLSSWEVNATANSWVDTSYLSVPRDDINKITLQNGNGEWNLRKGLEGDFEVAELAEDEELETSSINTIVSRVSSVSMLQPLGLEEAPAYRMDQPNAVVTIRTTGETITLLVGAKFTEDNSYVVKSSESPYYVRVAEFSVKNLVEGTHEDFVKLPPTPTPEGEQ